MRTRALSPGEAAPWFFCRASSKENFAFDTMAGRYVVLSFFGSASDANAAKMLAEVAAHRARFDDSNTCFFGVSTDPEDEKSARLRESLPGIRYIWDFDRA